MLSRIEFLSYGVEQRLVKACSDVALLTAVAYPVSTQEVLIILLISTVAIFVCNSAILRSSWQRNVHYPALSKCHFVVSVGLK